MGSKTAYVRKRTSEGGLSTPAAVEAGSPRLELDPQKCDEVARLLRNLPVPAEEEEIQIPDLPSASIGNFFLALVAICHQTSPPGKPPLAGIVKEQRRKGWDYLFARFHEAVSASPGLVTPRNLARVDSEDVRRIFRDPELGHRLTEPFRRAQLWNNLGEIMLRDGWESADDIYHHCGGWIHGRVPNLLDTLACFQAYSDPLKKKSFYFLALMQTAKLWAYSDPSSLGPPIDYHEVRGHLRLGTVRIKDQALLEKLRNRLTVTIEEDLEIRSRVLEAIYRISKSSGHTPIRLHYLFWNLFRAVCKHEYPRCFKFGSDCTLPSRYKTFSAKIGGGCPFATVCNSAGQEHPLCEHITATEYY